MSVRGLRYVVAVVTAAAGGTAATRRSVATWYPTLHKPSWTPPSGAFGSLWTVLYAQMAYSAQRVARSPDPRSGRALRLWWLQPGLNSAWTPVFFGARRPGPATLVIGALLPVVAATAAEGARVDRRAGLSTRPTWRGRPTQRR